VRQQPGVDEIAREHEQHAQHQQAVGGRVHGHAQESAHQQREQEQVGDRIGTRDRLRDARLAALGGQRFQQEQQHEHAGGGRGERRVESDADPAVPDPRRESHDPGGDEPVAHEIDAVDRRREGRDERAPDVGGGEEQQADRE